MSVPRGFLVRAAVVAALLAASLASDLGLFLGLALGTLVVPGYVAVERFVPDLDGRVAAYVLVSVLVSTQLIYLISLFLGYSLGTLRLALPLLLAPLLVAPRPALGRPERAGLAAYGALFLFCLGLLWDQIWFRDGDRIILSGSNWQDTPFHYEIIETLNQGNFPPMDPSFAGEPLHYHYFVDLHTAVLEAPLGHHPRILLYVNAALFPLFFIGVLGLGRRVTGSPRAALYGAVLTVFGWGFVYLWMFDAVLAGEFAWGANFVMDYGGLLNLPPPLDNLLQQRPLLIGLPGLAVSLAALVKGYEERAPRYVLFGGVVTGLLFPFHVLASFAACLLGGVYVAVRLAQERPGRAGLLRRVRVLLPFLVSLPLFAPHLGLLAPGGELGATWVSEFVPGSVAVHFAANLGLPLLLAAAAFLVGVRRRFVTGAWAAVLLLFPFLPSFTPNPWDMYKFFHVAWIPISLLAGQLLARVDAEWRYGRVVVALALVLSTLAVAPVLSWNSSDLAATDQEGYGAGVWIRSQTPQGAVFLTWADIHSPPSMVGGRPRVVGYLNWPYGHGIDIGRATERLNDVEAAYGDPGELRRVVEKYGVDYVYLGDGERRNLDGARGTLERSDAVERVYGGDSGVAVYRVTD